MSDGFSALEPLARLILDAELARLRAASEALEARRAALAEIGAARAARAAALHAGAGGDDPALSAGADAKWLAWLAARETGLAAEAARAAASREMQRRVAQKAFGRVEALRGLADAAEAARAGQRARRNSELPG